MILGFVVNLSMVSSKYLGIRYYDTEYHIDQIFI